MSPSFLTRLRKQIEARGSRAPMALIVQRPQPDFHAASYIGAPRAPTALAPAMLPVSRRVRWLQADIAPASVCHLSGYVDLAGNDLCAVEGRVRFLDAHKKTLPMPSPDQSEKTCRRTTFYPATQPGQHQAFSRVFTAPLDARHIEVCLMFGRFLGNGRRPTVSTQLSLVISPPPYPAHTRCA